MKKILISYSLLYFSFSIVLSQEPQTSPLPDPVKTGGMPLMEALNNRKSTRQFTQEKLSQEELSNLLWAAFGINRPENGKRTAPSARNCQEIDIYVVLLEGVFIYQPKDHSLKQVLAEDIRALTGKQDFVKDAPLNLLFIADYTRIGNKDDKNRQLWAFADAGFISQNIYLYCASEGIGTVVRGSFDSEALSAKLSLGEYQEIILSQTVGHAPK